MFEPPKFLHTGIQGILSGMAKRRMTEIMGQRDGLYQFFIQIQVASKCTPNLRNLQAMGQARAKQIAFMIDENLSLVF